MNIVNRLNIQNKLLLIFFISIIGLLLIGRFSIDQLYENLLDDRKIKTQHVVETTYDIIKYYGEQANKGALTKAQAQEQSLSIIKNLRYGDNEYFWINDMDTKMVMHPIKPELDGNDLSKITDPNGKKIFVEFNAVVKKKNKGFVNYLWPKPNSEQPEKKVSYVKGYQPWGWVIGSGIYINDVEEIYFKQVMSLGFIALIVLFIQAGLSWFLSQSITNSIKQLKSFVFSMIENCDLSQRVTVKDKAEIGEISNVLNELIGSFQNSICEVKKVADETLQAANSLSVVTEQTRKGVDSTAEQTEHVASAMMQMSTAVSEVANSTSAAALAAESAEAKTKDGDTVVKDTISSINKLALDVEQGAEVIVNVENQALNISSVVDVISGVAEQTNLLALNAAIEAARAGEQGRGFAVVADEVRSLAQKTQDSTNEILKIVDNLQTATKQAVGVMQNGKKRALDSVEKAGKLGETLDNISQAVNSITDMSLQIAAATDQQSSVVQEINSNVKVISNIAGETADGANHTATASEQLKALAEKLEDKISIYKLG